MSKQLLLLPIALGVLLAGAAAQSDASALGVFKRAFGPGRATDRQAERERAAAAIIALDDARVAAALLDAYARLDRDALPHEAERRDYLEKERKDVAAMRRIDLDALRALQERLLGHLAALRRPESVAVLVTAAIEDGRALPFSLRVRLAARAGEVPDLAAGPVGKRLARTRRDEGLLVALTAARSLGPEFGTTGTPAVIRQLGHRDPPVRERAADALAALASPTAIEPLIELLERSEGRTRQRIGRALDVLTGVGLGSSAVAWRRWLAAEGGPWVRGERPLGGGTPASDAEASGAYHGIPQDGDSILYLIDDYQSMQAKAADGVTLWDVAKRELVLALNALPPRKRFDVIAFADRTLRFEAALVPATPGTVRRACEWLDGLELRSQTTLHDALDLAFLTAGRSDADRHRPLEADTIFLLTDGEGTVPDPGSGSGMRKDDPARTLDAVSRWNVLGRVVIHSIGLGRRGHKGFLGQLAASNGGLFVHDGQRVPVATAPTAPSPSPPRPQEKQVRSAMRRADDRPNVVFFLVDDMGWTDPAVMGSDFHETPHIDRLAAQGMTFTDAYACGPNCAPSRASIMSGQYPPRHGIYTVGSPERGRAELRRLVPTPNRTVLADEVVTIAEALHEAGYATAHVGKWHLGPDPTTQGFDVNLGGAQHGHPPGGYFSPYRNPALPDGPAGEYLTDRLTQEALRLIERFAERPFFLHFAHFAVHTPIQSPDDVTDRYRSKTPGAHHRHARYAAMIERVDASLGAVVARLDELGLAENTVVIFSSDNGGLLGVTSMAPLRGGKGMLYEGGTRVPLVVRWTGRVAAGSTAAVPVTGVDLYPTLIELAGRAADGRDDLDGVSVLPLLTGETSLARDALFWHFPAYLEAGGRGADPWRTTPAGAIRMGRWKLIEFFEEGRTELYDLAVDAGESKDLASREPKRTAELLARLRTWRTTVGAPVPTEPNPAFVAEALRRRREGR